MRSPGGTVPGGGYRRLGEEGRATCATLVWMRLGKRPGIGGESLASPEMSLDAARSIQEVERA